MSTYSSIVHRIALGVKDTLEGDYPGGTWLSALFSPAQAAADRANFDSLKRIYQTCVQNERTAGLRDLKAVMNTIADLYPAQEDSGLTPNRTVAMGRTLAFFVRNGLSSLVDIGPSNPRLNPLEPPRDGLPLWPILEVRPGDEIDDIKFSGLPPAPNQAYYDLGAEILSVFHPTGLDRKAARALISLVIDLEIQIV